MKSKLIFISFLTASSALLGNPGDDKGKGPAEDALTQLKKIESNPALLQALANTALLKQLRDQVRQSSETLTDVVQPVTPSSSSASEPYDSPIAFDEDDVKPTSSSESFQLKIASIPSAPANVPPTVPPSYRREAPRSAPTNVRSTVPASQANNDDIVGRSIYRQNVGQHQLVLRNRELYLFYPEAMVARQMRNGTIKVIAANGTRVATLDQNLNITSSNGINNNINNNNNGGIFSGQGQRGTSVNSGNTFNFNSNNNNSNNDNGSSNRALRYQNGETFNNFSDFGRTYSFENGHYIFNGLSVVSTTFKFKNATAEFINISGVGSTFTFDRTSGYQFRGSRNLVGCSFNK